jgi:methyltransferase (TIGR00027 family)
MSDQLFRNISDTAIWAAMYRAEESERRDAYFSDPFARKLAGTRGEQIQSALKTQQKNAWAWVTRTIMFDAIINEQIADGVDVVINLAAGLDARPYRMNVPRSLRWIEVDLPAIIEYKADVLRGDEPRCALERVPLDLRDVAARRAFFERVGGTKVLVISEGLIIYLDDAEVVTLANDLRRFQRWVTDVASPGLVAMLKKQVGTFLDEANAPLKFGPREGPEWFEQHGWKVLEVRPTIKHAPKKRIPWPIRLFAYLPQPKKHNPNMPWSAACLLG